MAVTIKNNFGTAINAMKIQMGRAAEIIGGMAESYAKENLTKNGSVVTGNLRNSITHEYRPASNTVVIGTSVEYAPYVELGTIAPKRSPKPYLQPAAGDHIDEYKEVLKSELES